MLKGTGHGIQAIDESPVVVHVPLGGTHRVGVGDQEVQAAIGGLDLLVGGA